MANNHDFNNINYSNNNNNNNNNRVQESKQNSDDIVEDDSDSDDMSDQQEWSGKKTWHSMSWHQYHGLKCILIHNCKSMMYEAP